MVRVGVDPALTPVPAEQIDSLVGKRAALDVAAGSLLTTAAATDKALPGAGVSIVGVAVGPGGMPVSYTHLDVYKRQDQESAMAARTRPTSWGIAMTISVAAVLTSCSSDPGASSKSPSSSSSIATSVAPTASTTSLSPAEVDKRSASQAVVQLWSELDKLAGDPNLTLTSLAQVARCLLYTSRCV